MTHQSLSIRTGIGFDVHRFAAGRPLILGGVHIPHEPGLEGHSDADVLTHAVCDAILGAAGLGDIGRHFPDSDECWRGADSLDLLARCVAMAHEAGFAVGHIDATVIAERPKIAPFAPAMIENLLERLGPGASINIKATTMEAMGALGRGEGMAALAVATLHGRS
ncbi:MAG: 2-C-methyl-D-erythritol 2,4-cyclodiphosphate synthase [Candidatus Sumerlaeia bacterium]